MRSVIIALFAMFCVTSAMKAADSSLVFTKSPTKAITYSLIFPGLGQLYNDAYWKVPLFAGGAIATAWLFFQNNASFNTSSDLYDAALASGTSSDAGKHLRDREFYRDNRDLAGVFFLLTYGLAAMDAYVGAHLYDFDVSEDISMTVGPTRSHLMALNVQFHF